MGQLNLFSQALAYELRPELPDPCDHTLQEAQEEFVGRLPDGTTCPCCGRWGKVYGRALNYKMAAGLRWIVYTWEQNDAQWIDVPNTGPRWLLRSNQHPTLRWWDLLERKPNTEDDTRKHTGFYRPTEEGLQFVNGMIRVPKKVFTFDDNVIAVSKEEIDIWEVAGYFDYEEVMSPAYEPMKPPKELTR